MASSPCARPRRSGAVPACCASARSTTRCMTGVDARRRARRGAGAAPVSDFTRAVFLDRDGTLIEEVGYLDRPERVALYPWSDRRGPRAEPRAASASSWSTNQSGVARGFFTEAVVDEVHRHIAALLAAGGAHLDAYYYCPHHPDGKVDGVRAPLRLPQAGARPRDRAVAEFGVDPAALLRRRRSLARHRPGARRRRARPARANRVRRDRRNPPARGPAADAVVDNLIEAVGWILRALALSPEP